MSPDAKTTGAYSDPFVRLHMTSGATKDPSAYGENKLFAEIGLAYQHIGNENACTARHT